MKKKIEFQIGIFLPYFGKILAIFCIGNGPDFGPQNGLENPLILLVQGKTQQVWEKDGSKQVEYMQVPNWTGPGVQVTRNNTKIYLWKFLRYH